MRDGRARPKLNSEESNHPPLKSFQNIKIGRSEGVETYDIAEEPTEKTPESIKLVEMKELLSFLKKISGEHLEKVVKTGNEQKRLGYFKQLVSRYDAEKAKGLFLEGLAKLERTDSQRLTRLGAGNPLDDLSGDSAVAESASLSLKNLQPQLVELFRKPPDEIVATFAQDALSKIHGIPSERTQRLATLLDQARLGFILASGAGLRDEDRSAGAELGEGKMSSKKSKPSAGSAEPKKELTAEEKIAQKKARILHGNRPPKEEKPSSDSGEGSAPPEEDAPSEIELLRENDASVLRHHLDAARSNLPVLKKAYGALKSIALPKDVDLERFKKAFLSPTETPDQVDNAELLQRFIQDKVYNAASTMLSWFEAELRILERDGIDRSFQNLTLSVEKSEQRAKQLGDRWEKTEKFHLAATSHLRVALQALAEQVEKLEQQAGETIEFAPTEREEVKSFAAMARGELIRILESENSISIDALRAAREEQKARREKISEEKNNLRKGGRDESHRDRLI